MTEASTATSNPEAALEAFFADKTHKKVDATVKNPEAIREIQQALIDLKKLDPKTIKLGEYDAATSAAVVAYRKSRNNAGTPVNTNPAFTGGDKTLVEDHFEDREAYAEAAEPDKVDRTRPLDTTDKDKIKEIYKEEEKDIQETYYDEKFVTDNRKKLVADITRQVQKVLDGLHQKKYSDKKEAHDKGVALEKEEVTENPYLYPKEALEGSANAAQKAVNKVYGGLAKGAKKPSFKMGKNLFDQWELAEAEITTAKEADAKDNGSRISQRAQRFLTGQLMQHPQIKNTTDALEVAVGQEAYAALKAAAIQELLQTPDNVEKLIRLEQAWSGVADMSGIQSLQRFKPEGAEAQRLEQWKLFYTSIHEYLHLLMHPKYLAWVKTHKGKKKYILTEGVCEFFTLNVYAKFPPSALKAYQNQVEGLDPKTVSPATVPSYKQANRKVYPEHQQAEQLAKTVGIHNLQAAYFQGKTNLIDEK